MADRYGRRRPLMANVLFFSSHRAALRLRAQLHRLLHLANAVRHRHGRRVGRGRLAGHGARARALARRALRHSAGRISHRLSAGRRGRSTGAAEVGLARHVLGRRHSRAACALHSHQGSRVGSVEAASPDAHHRRPAHRMATQMAVALPDRADVPDELPRRTARRICIPTS